MNKDNSQKEGHETYGDQMRRLIKTRREKHKKRAQHKKSSVEGTKRREKRMRDDRTQEDYTAVDINNMQRDKRGRYYHFNRIKNIENYMMFDDTKLETKEDWDELDKHNAFIFMQRDLKLFRQRIKPVPGISKKIKSYRLEHSSAPSSSEDEDKFFIERARECIKQKRTEIEKDVKTFWRTKERYLDGCVINSHFFKEDWKSLKRFKSKFNE
jgi:hypothetical protein